MSGRLASPVIYEGQVSTDQTDHIPTRDHGAPTIFFDHVPTVGVRDGVGHVMLSMAQFYPEGSQISADRVVVAHLRTGLKGLQELKRAVDAALLIATPAQGQPGREAAN
jgi:hypothetical protein